MRASVEQIRRLSARFAVEGEVCAVTAHGGGLIHDSFVVAFASATSARRIFVQRMNRAVFPEPLRVLRNVARVTAHLRGKLQANAALDLDRRVLTPISTHDGELCVRDEAGEVFRAYAHIERAHSVCGEPTPHHARQAGRAFGAFQAALADLPPPALDETLEGFHDTATRLVALADAAQRDSHGRASGVLAELDAVFARRPLVACFYEAIVSGELPRRVVHNDTKLDNLLFDDASGEALCVVDLDTTMPGIGAHDFGDLARSLAFGSGEGPLRMPLLAAAIEGYLEAIGSPTANDRAFLSEAPRLLALELGARFLTDHLRGDPYFAVTRPNENLERAREQLRLVVEIERHAPELRALFR